jgi:hypothetical protein
VTSQTRHASRPRRDFPRRAPLDARLDPCGVIDTDEDPGLVELGREIEMERHLQALAVPIPAVPDAYAVVCLFSPAAGAFNLLAVAAVEDFAEHAALTLRQTMTSTSLDPATQDLSEAAESRRIIDLACGAIMAQNRCSQAEALKTLIDAAKNRKQQVLLIATEFLHSLVMGSDQSNLGSSPTTSDN